MKEEALRNAEEAAMLATVDYVMEDSEIGHYSVEEALLFNGVTQERVAEIKKALGREIVQREDAAAKRAVLEVLKELKERLQGMHKLNPSVTESVEALLDIDDIITRYTKGGTGE